MGLPARHPDNVVSLTEPDVLSFHFVLQDSVNTAVLNFATLRVFDVQGPNETLKKLRHLEFNQRTVSGCGLRFLTW